MSSEIVWKPALIYRHLGIVHLAATHYLCNRKTVNIGINDISAVKGATLVT